MSRWVVLVSSLAVGIVLGQQGAKLYQGAKLDEAATNEARPIAAAQPGVEMTVYVTSESFDRVYSYYKKNSKEYKVLGSGSRKLPNGQELKEAFFILDGKDDLVSSKRSLKIQRPYIGQYGLARSGANQSQIRDITAITLTTRK